MFADRFDALMNVAEVSNSLLGRDVHMNPSYIGRLRSGARPLPKKHEYISPICRYLARHITKDYQENALCKLTGIDGQTLENAEDMAAYLEAWLLSEEEIKTSEGDKLIKMISAMESQPKPVFPKVNQEIPLLNEDCFYGKEGKRRAVEQFFLRILQEKKPQTLLLFSDENMDWMYEDRDFAARWAQLFLQVISKGNRVKIIHTLSRDLNEMLEAVGKWLPIYMTGMVEPYYYPRLRDGIMKRSLFIAPNTAAVVSSSVGQNTDGMLNQLLTGPASVAALSLEYKNFYALCRPLMHIFTERNMVELKRYFYELNDNEGNSCLCSSSPISKDLPEQLQFLNEWEEKGEDFQIRLVPALPDNMIFYVKDGAGAIIVKDNKPMVAFVVDERNMTNAIWDYLMKE